MMARALSLLMFLTGCTSLHDAEWCKASLEAWQIGAREYLQAQGETSLPAAPWSLETTADHLVLKSERARLRSLLIALLHSEELHLPLGWEGREVSISVVGTSHEELAQEVVALLQGTLRRSSEGWEVVSVAPPQDPNQVISRTFYLEHLPTSSVQALLLGNSSSSSLGSLLNTSSIVHAGFSPEANLVFLRGPYHHVERMVQTLEHADRAPPEVLVDCLLAVGTEQIAMTIAAQPLIQAEAFALNLAAAPATGSSSQEGVISLTVYDVDRPATESLPMELLVSRLSSQVLSNPHLYCLSGSAASLYVGRIGYRFFTQSSGTSSTIGVNPITTGVTLDVTPVVMGNGQIQLTMNLTTSDFAQDNPILVANQIARTASTVVMVRPGQIIHIGGLRYPLSNPTSSGTAWLRKVPLLKWLVTKQTDLDQSQNLDLFLVVATPPSTLGAPHALAGYPPNHALAEEM